MTRVVLLVALLLTWSGLCVFAGYTVCQSRWQADVARQAEEAANVLQAAQSRGHALSGELETTYQRIDQLQQEASHAIVSSTTGRTCFDGAALRVLNGAPGVTVMPAPASSAADARESTPAPSGADAFASSISTDTDVALWATAAAAQFEVCRARLAALIDWHTTVDSP